jgi:hypothetical protein
MPLPSFYVSGDRARAWSVGRAGAYGAGIGALAALFKTFGPGHAVVVAAPALEVAGAAAFFALLCAGAAALRNFILRRLIRPELP